MVYDPPTRVQLDTTPRRPRTAATDNTKIALVLKLYNSNKEQKKIPRDKLHCWAK